MSWAEKTLNEIGIVKTSTLSFSDAKKLSTNGQANSIGVKVSDMNTKGNEVFLKKSETFFSLNGDVLQKKTVPEDSIVFPKRGAAISTNKKRITTCNTILDPNLIAFIPGDSVDIMFLYFWFLTFDLRKIQSLGPTPQLNKKDVNPIKIPLPPLPEQKKIAHILSTIQEAREKTEAVIEAARELKKSMMKHLFTYGPVPVSEAENVKLKETEIGMAPEEWELITLNNLAEKSYSGGTPKTSIDEYWNGGINWTTSASLEDLFLDSTDRKISELGLKKSSSKLVPADSVLIGSRVRVGVSVVNKIPVAISQDIIAVEPDTEKIQPTYLALTLRNPFFVNYFEANKRGATIKGIPKKDVLDLKVPLPTMKVQKDIVDSVITLDKKITTEENKKRSLESLFQSMLQKLMTGELSVSNLNLES